MEGAIQWFLVVKWVRCRPDCYRARDESLSITFFNLASFEVVVEVVGDVGVIGSSEVTRVGRAITNGF
jgi:hypothetical protein